MSFPTTRWTILAEATLHGDASGRAALECLCEHYRRPVEQFVASRGYGLSEQQDLVQEFFLRWLRSRAWKRADRLRGKFRTFMLGALNHLLAHEQARKSAQKRGGGVAIASLDDAAFVEELPELDRDAVGLFDREWAVALVANALVFVEAEYAQRGRAEAFAVLRRFLPSGGELISLEAAAVCLNTNAGAVKAAVHRLRERFREVLRAAVAATVAAPHEVDEELRYLRSLMALSSERIIAPQNGKNS